MSDPVLEIPFAGGFDESTQEELQPPSTFTLLQNGRCTKRGGYEKRLGFTSLASTRLDATSRSAGHRLLMNGSQPCVIDGANIDVYSPAAARWIQRSRVPEATVRPLEVPNLGPVKMSDPITSATRCDVCAVGSYLAVLWRTGLDNAASTLYARVALLDAATGAVVYGPHTLATTSATLDVRLATDGTYVFAFLGNSGTAELTAYQLNTTSPATISLGWVAYGFTITSAYAGGLNAVNLTGTAAVGWVNTSGGTSRVSVTTLSGAGGLLATVNINTASTTPTALGMSEGHTTTTLWVSWSESDVIKAIGLNESTLTTTATTGTIFTAASTNVYRIQVGPRTGGEAAVYVVIQEEYTQTRGITTSAGAATSEGSTTLYGDAVIRSRPVLRNGRLYAHFTSVLGDALILCDCTPDTSGAGSLTSYLRPVANPVVRGLFTTSGDRVAVTSSTTYAYGFSVKKTGATDGGALVEYDFGNAERWQAAPTNGSTYLGGGVVGLFDGTRWIESGFLLAPKPASITSVAAAGSLTFTLGGRGYAVTFAEVDADGNYHISGVSTPSALTGNIASKRVALSGYPLSITARGIVADAAFASTAINSSLRIQIWGTLDGGEPPYFFVGEIQNVPNTATWAFTDNVTDAVLATRAMLYGTGALPGTNSSSQDHRAPPGLTHIVAYAGMLVGAHGKTLYYSSQPIDGEGAWWSPAFLQVVDEDITALWVQDGALFASSRAHVWAFSGEPPSDNGYQGGLSTGRKLAVEFGCINANSVVTTDLGTFYQSARGLELFTRGQTSDFVGDPISETLASYPVVTAAVLDTKNALVRFSLATAQTSGLASGTGVDVVFDLVLRVWSSRDTHTSNTPAQHAGMCYVGSAWRYCWLGADGTLYYERATDDAAAHKDASAWVTLKAVTPWLHLGAVQGDQLVDQILLLAKKSGRHRVTISIAYDYVDTWVETQTFTAALIDTLGREWLVRGLTQTTSNAVRVQLEDADVESGSNSNGKGGTWVCLTLNGKPHQGPRRSTAAQRGGS